MKKKAVSERVNLNALLPWPRKRWMQLFLLGLSITILSGCGQDPAQTIEASDGVPIVYENFGDGETAVVFVHCWTCNRAFWRNQIEPVAAAGFRVVTLDLPGHGNSGKDRSDWSVDGLAADVATVIDVLGLFKVILVGHSMGAPVSLAAMQHLPERVTGIVSVDMLHDVEYKWPKEAIEQFLDDLQVNYSGTLEFFFSMFFPPDANPEVVEWVKSQITTADQAAALALMEDLVYLDEAAVLKQAGVPVRAINAAPYGEMSIPTAIETNRKYNDFDAVVMDGVGHFPQLEQPEVFNMHLLEILAELSVSSK